MAGPYFFAWVDAGTAFDAGTHAVEDEQVMAWTIEHNEGDFPSLDIDVINPQTGLLAPGRKVWAWLSMDKGFGTDTPNIVPLFFGRLVGIPDDLEADVVKLSFIARPEDYDEQKATVAETLKVAPYWDSVWFSPDTANDPDNILESRPELWHIDRVTLEVTSSNILVGEDGTLSFDESQIFYDSVHTSFGQVPIRNVNVTANVSWTQVAEGDVDLTGFCYTDGGYSITSYTGDGLMNDWPKPGASFGGGWTVKSGSCVRVDAVGLAVWGYSDGGISGSGGANFGRVPDRHDVIVPEWSTVQTILGTTFPAHVLHMPKMRLIPTLVAHYSASRNRSETLSFTLSADVQAMVTDTGGDDTVDINVSSSELTTSDGTSMPIGDPASAVYFTSARGTASIEYLICLARAKMLSRARTVEVEFEIPFTLGIDSELSCRKSAVVTDYRLPGGQAGGKIMGYTLSVDGESGAQTCSIKLGASIGKGGTVTDAAGDPTYCDSDYVGADYQRYSDNVIMPLPGEVAYTSIEGLGPTQDDGNDFSRMTPGRVIAGKTVTGTPGEQEAAMGDKADEPNTVFTRLNTVPTTIQLDLKPVTGGPFASTYALALTDLKIPKTIDLEAS